MSIDRKSLLERHNPILSGFDTASPLSVGNGDFAFTSDATGMQTLAALYDKACPLCSMASWGWHSFPDPGKGYARGNLRLKDYDAYGRKVGYATSSEGQEELFSHLRENPHRLNLGRIVLTTAEGPIGTEDRFGSIRQVLRLREGILESSFRLDGDPVRVSTCCHRERDAVAFRIESPAIPRLRIALSFPYGSPGITASDWKAEVRHESALFLTRAGEAWIGRTLDGDRYFCAILAGEGARISRMGAHAFEIVPGTKAGAFEATFEFLRCAPTLPAPSYSETECSSREGWAEFWDSGACVELAESRDPRALELERRILRSRYQTRVNCAGTSPPAETGLVCNSWYGKFHIEMHYWHAAHFPLWGQSGLLERSFGYYRSIAEAAKRRAAEQGYAGLRWPKMTDPSGEDSPSPIGPLLVWQQPHFISMAELVRRSKRGSRFVDEWADLVFASAEFMADYAKYDGSRFVLGPPVIPAQENHDPNETINPCYELEYWRYGLETANAWRSLLGLPENSKWRKVERGLAELPVGNGVYLSHERCPESFGSFARDHPSMTAALGLLPGGKADRETMRRTLEATRKNWDFASTWGWDFPMLAMSAARSGSPGDAVDFLLMDEPKNSYLANGHNPQKPRADLPLYLPGNGALLIAIAMMAGGWDGSSGAAPGFPNDGTWTVRTEGISPLP